MKKSSVLIVAGVFALVAQTFGMHAAERPLEDRFQNLTMEDRREVGPLFWLHGTETPEQLVRLVGVVAESGQGCLTIESRNHCDWMGPQWWKDLEIVLAAAKKLNLKVLLFDDPWWPSQALQGRVPDEHGCHVVEPAVARKGEAVPSVASNEICRVTCRAVSDGVYEPDAEGDTVVIFRDERRDVRVFEGNKLLRTVNGLDPKSVRWFIDTVYEEHYRRCKPYFDDGTIIGFFFDEPETHGDWGTDLKKLMNERNDDVDLGRLLLAYKFALPDAKESSELKHRFLMARAEAWGRTMYGELSAWCRAHGVFLSGHFMEQADAYYSQKLNAGDLMAMEKYVDVPGVDLVCQQYYPEDQQPGAVARGYPGELANMTRREAMGQMPKVAASTAHVRNAHGGLNWCEIFGGYSQNLTSLEMKWLADWHHVRGCHWLIPHSFNPKAPFDSDYPPYFYNGGREPRFPLFRVWADYTSRVALMLSGAAHRCPIAQVVPGQHVNTCRAIRPENFTFAVMDAQLDCDWLTVDDLAAARLTKDPVTGLPAIRSTKGDESYPVLVLPASEQIEEEALEKALAFAESGGRVLGYGVRPSGPLSEKIFAQPTAAFLPFEPDAKTVLSAMPKEVVAENAALRNGEGPRSNLHVRHVVRGTDEIWFVVNQSTTERRTVGIPDVKPGRVLEVWNPMSGVICALCAPAVVLEPSQSAFFVMRDRSSAGALSRDEGERVGLELKVTAEVTDLPPPQKGEVRGPYGKTVFTRAAFEIPESAAAKGVVLRCRGMDGEAAARVTVNGVEAGGFIGEPHELDISRFVRKGKNELTLTPFAAQGLEVIVLHPCRR